MKILEFLAPWLIIVGALFLLFGIWALWFTSDGIKPPAYIGAALAVCTALTIMYKDINTSLSNQQVKGYLDTLVGYATGEDSIKKINSYCYIKLGDMLSKGEFLVYLYYKGNYPITDLILNTDGNFAVFDPNLEYHVQANHGFKSAKRFQLPTIGASYANGALIGRIKSPPDLDPHTWSVSFSKDGGQKKWFQRIVFKVREPIRSNGATHRDGFEYMSQVYNLKSDTITHKLKGADGVINEFKEVRYSQEIIREFRSPGHQLNVGWNEIPHDIDENGSNHNFNFKTEPTYLKGAKDPD